MSQLDLGPYSRTLVLTGAGFSKNWGGFLAREMTRRVLRHADPLFRYTDLLVAARRFESVVWEVDTGDEYSGYERQDLRAAVRRAFADHDDQIRVFGESAARFLRSLMIALAGPARHGGALTSLFFTVNQDRLLERWCTTPRAPLVR